MDMQCCFDHLQAAPVAHWTLTHIGHQVMQLLQKPMQTGSKSSPAPPQAAKMSTPGANTSTHLPVLSYSYIISWSSGPAGLNLLEASLPATAMVPFTFAGVMVQASIWLLPVATTTVMPCFCIRLVTEAWRVWDHCPAWFRSQRLCKSQAEVDVCPDCLTDYYQEHSVGVCGRVGHVP